jgi:hypothetical protein
MLSVQSTWVQDRAEELADWPLDGDGAFVITGAVTPAVGGWYDAGLRQRWAVLVERLESTPR